jgi:WD40 repeat protein
MPASSRVSSHGLPPTVWERLEAVLQRFEDAWRGGGRPAPEDYLPADGPERRALLVELVHADLHYRLQAGEPARVESYLRQYSELRDDLQVACELIVAEYRMRREREPDLTADEYRRRFPEHAGELSARLRSAPPAPGSDSGEARATVFRSSSPATAPASPVAAPPGYEILGELGRGGMGVVYQARQTKLDRLVALKLILSGTHAGADDLARFKTEAEAIARLQHPNIVQIHEIGEQEGRPFFSLEFCAGGSLEKKLNGTPLPPREAAALVETLARAMQAAHQKGIVHRDLKPANVLLAEDGTPKITDFGLAKKLDEAGQTASGAVLGTPSYMAPEQAGGKSKEIGPYTDVYALGAILYECLTGRPPFRAATALDTLLQVVSDEPVPPRQLQSQVPHDLNTICLKCLHKEPRKRYGSCEELAEDLGRFMRGEPVRARPVGEGERLWRWCRRNPLLAAGTATIALALTTIAVLAVVAARNAQAVAEAERAAAEAERENARKDAQRLHGALVEQARAERLAGFRGRALKRIAEAAAIHVTPELRREAIQAITSAGVRFVKEVPADFENSDITAVVIVARVPEFSFRLPETWPAHIHVTTSRTSGRPAPASYLVGDELREKELTVYLRASAGDGPDIYVASHKGGSQTTLQKLPPGFGQPQAARLSADGEWLTFRDATDANVMRVWDLQRRALHGRLDCRSDMALVRGSFAVAEYSPDSVLLATTQLRAGQVLFQLDELPSCRSVMTLPGRVPCCWTDDGNYLLTCGASVEGTKPVAGEQGRGKFCPSVGDVQLHFAQVWEVACPAPYFRTEGEVFRLAFRPDGKQLAVNGTLWDLRKGPDRAVLRRTPVESANGVLAFRGPEVWSVPLLPQKERGDHSTREMASGVALAGAALAAEVGTAGGLAAVGSFMARLEVIASANLRASRVVPPGSAVQLESVLPYGTRKATQDEAHKAHADDKVTNYFSVHLLYPNGWAWCPNGRLLLGDMSGWVQRYEKTTDSLWLRIGSDFGREFALWDATTGQRRKLTFPPEEHDPNRAQASVTITLDANGKQVPREGLDPWTCHAFAFGPDGQQFVTVGTRGVQVWDVERGEVTRTLSRDWFEKVAWGRDGRVLATGPWSSRKPPNFEAVLFDAAGKELARWPAPEGLWGVFILSPDANWVFHGGPDGLVRIRDVITGKELASWTGHEAAITALTISPDGTLLVSGARDGTIRVWNLPWIREELAKLGLDWDEN